MLFIITSRPCCQFSLPKRLPREIYYRESFKKAKKDWKWIRASLGSSTTVRAPPPPPTHSILWKTENRGFCNIRPKGLTIPPPPPPPPLTFSRRSGPFFFFEFFTFDTIVTSISWTGIPWFNLLGVNPLRNCFRNRSTVFHLFPYLPTPPPLMSI